VTDSFGCPRPVLPDLSEEIKKNRLQKTRAPNTRIFQTSPDCVVKCQVLDIVGVVLLLV
jgi:hypothetical protein